jgi:hypothetical protein
MVRPGPSISVQSSGSFTQTGYAGSAHGDVSVLQRAELASVGAALLQDDVCCVKLLSLRIKRRGRYQILLIQLVWRMLSAQVENKPLYMRSVSSVNSSSLAIQNAARLAFQAGIVDWREPI